MRFYLPLLLSFTLLSFQQANAQIYRLEEQYNRKVKVKVNGVELKSPWAGGLHHPQFTQADIDNDGRVDLIAFESFKGYEVLGVKTFMNVGSAGSPVYVHNPDFEYLFPRVRMYMKLVDYNNDNIPDLFHYGYKGMEVCDGYYNSQNRLTFRNCRDIEYNYGSGLTTIPVSNGDIPAVLDVDDDGDVDVLVYNILDNDLMLWYKNLCKEEGLPLSDFKMRIADNCWGKMSSNYSLNREHNLGVSCSNFPVAPPGGGGPYNNYKTTGAGNHCFAIMDVDEDGDYDVFDGNVVYNELQLVINGKANIPGLTIDSMIAQDTTWQSGGTKVVLPGFPVAFPADVNLDGRMALLISPYAEGTEDVDCVVYYENTGVQGAPVYTYQTNNLVVRDMIDAGSNSYPVFYDFDKDGKKDMLIGSSRYDKATSSIKSQLSLYKNTGTGNDVSFEFVTDNVANLSTYNYGSIAPAIGDIDNDGLDELIVGKEDGTLALFRNHAPNSSLPPVWQLWQTSMVTKFGTIIDAELRAAPCFYDVDKDGKKDLIVGGSKGYLMYIHNEGVTPQDLKLVQVTDKLGDVFVGYRDSGYEYEGYSAPFAGRIDNTQKEYLLVGNDKGIVARYDGVDKPYTQGIVYPRLDSVYSGIVLKGRFASPVVTDLDGDATKMEMYAGNSLGGVFYLQQIFNDGVEEKNIVKRQLEVYPNPATNMLNINLTNVAGTKDGEIALYDATGRAMARMVVKQGQQMVSVNIENMPEGVYLCTLLLADGERYNSIFVKK